MLNYFYTDMVPAKEANDKTLKFRASERQRTKYDRAAEQLGMDFSVFARQALDKASTEVLEAQRHHHMTADDVAAFVAALDAKPAPTPVAVAAARNYRARVVHAD